MQEKREKLQDCPSKPISHHSLYILEFLPILELLLEEINGEMTAKAE